MPIWGLFTIAIGLNPLNMGVVSAQVPWRMKIGVEKAHGRQQVAQHYYAQNIHK
jgi:hypothetical protein